MCAACGVRGGGGLRGRLLWYSDSEEVCKENKTRRESVKETTTTTTPQPPSPSQTREEGRMHIHVCMEIEGESDLVLTDPIPHQRPDLHPFSPHVHTLVAHEETFFHLTPFVPIAIGIPIRMGVSFWCPTVRHGVHSHPFKVGIGGRSCSILFSKTRVRVGLVVGGREVEIPKRGGDDRTWGLFACESRSGRLGPDVDHYR